MDFLTFSALKMIDLLAARFYPMGFDLCVIARSEATWQSVSPTPVSFFKIFGWT